MERARIGKNAGFVRWARFWWRSGVMSNALFNTPKKSSEKDWFGVAIGNIYVVSINTEVDFNSVSSTQYTELRTIFETEFDRAKTPWLIVSPPSTWFSRFKLRVRTTGLGEQERQLGRRRHERNSRTLVAIVR